MSSFSYMYIINYINCETLSQEKNCESGPENYNHIKILVTPLHLHVIGHKCRLQFFF